MSKILIIEDEPTIVDLISFNLKREGFEVDVAYDGVTGLEKALRGDADLVLLDVMLPGMNGFDVLQKLRQESDVPVIMVTAREEERDKVFGLETGA
ncbi:MAG: response regulator, partial [Clostridia bacterium]|nr:response regulator [Clostridia bacterium]